MALESFNDLAAEVAGWLDDADLASQAPTFVRLAEARFNRVLRTNEMEAAGTIPAAGETASLPLGFLEMRSLWVEGSPDRPLEQTTLINLKTSFPGSGKPQAYAIQGDQIYFGPTPASAVTLTTIYYAALPALSPTRATNWLLKAHPDVYLLGCLVAAELRGWNDDRLPLLKAALDEALGEITQAAVRRRHGGSPLVGRSAVRPVAGVRI